MPEPSIVRGSEHFFNVLYEGNGGGQRVGNFVPYTDNGTIAKSLIFNDGDNAYIQRTNDSGDRTRATISFWVKRSYLGSVQYIFDVYDGSSTNDGMMRFNTNNTMSVRLGSASSLLYITNRTFEDTSKWYHFVFAVNTNESTADDRAKLYVDGERITSFSTQTNSSQSSTTMFNYSSATFRLGSSYNGSYDFDGYIAEFNYIDGTVYEPSTFGMTDTSTGRWIPKTLTGITYGTNGHRLEFANSAGQTIGDDTSGNTNDFSVTNLVAGDITTDSPTQNFPILDSNRNSLTLTEGNTVGASPGTGIRFAFSGMTFDPSDSTGYYMEFKLLQPTYSVCGFRSDTDPLPISTGTTYVSDGYLAMNYAEDLYLDGTRVYNGSSTWSTNDIVGFYIKENKLYYSLNGVMQNSSNHVGVFSKPGRYRITVGHNANYSPYAKVQIICPQSKWNHTPSGDFSDYREINQDNAPETSKGMSDFVWIKNRDSTDDHQLYDNSRGPQKMLEANQSSAEETDTDGLQKFLKGGCQIEDDVRVNTSGESYVSWNWVANGGTTTANTDGSGATLASTIQANQTAGFSIVTYTGNASAGAKVAHGLSQAPDWFIIKSRSVATNWYVYHKDLGASSGLYLNTNAAAGSGSANAWNQTDPTSSVITLNGTGYGSNNNSATYLMYCWHEVPGYSKFGIYTGGGGTDGTFTYTGFKPAWLLVKRHNSTGNWYLLDTARGKFNDSDGSGKTLMPNHTNAEAVQTRIDLLSNGFKQRISNDGSNLNSVPYVYFAFAEHPFIGDGINPATAR